MLRQLRNQTAVFLSNELRKLLPPEFSDNDAVSVANLENVLEQPKNLEHGHLAFPVFSLAKLMRQGPPPIAAKIATHLQSLVDGNQVAQELGLEKALAVGGYVNLTFSGLALQNRLFAAIRDSKGKLGYSLDGKGKKIVIDYSSPNVAKPMHVGTLRATVIGQAIRNIAETQGYEVIGLNHLGDWGVQFGKLAWAYQKWGDQYDFKNAPFQSLFDLYVKFHDEAAKNPALDAEGSLVFKRLEQGDKEIEKIWKMFVDITLVEDQKLWDLLGVKHDLVRGESFYNDRLKPVEDLLEKKGLLQESEGAMVVPMGDDIRRALEAAGVRYRDEEDLGAALGDVDVVYQTRIQKERFASPEEYQAARGTYIIPRDSLDAMKPDAILLHPLPRVDEITTDVDADPRAAYFRQAHNGVYVRMALLDLVINPAYRDESAS